MCRWPCADSHDTSFVDRNPWQNERFRDCTFILNQRNCVPSWGRQILVLAERPVLKSNLWNILFHSAVRVRHCCTFFIVVKRIMNGHGRVKLTTQPDMSVFVSDYFSEQRERERDLSIQQRNYGLDLRFMTKFSPLLARLFLLCPVYVSE